jgi:hypothetical protein
MKTLGRILFFIAILIVSALSLLLLFPGMKEGLSWRETPFYFAGAAGLVVVGALWWLACGRSWLKAAVGWAVLAIPLYLGLTAGVSLVAAHLRGQRLQSGASIENYRETPILWPGFAGPVGLTVSLDLIHPAGAQGRIYPPEIRMGPVLAIASDRLFASYTSGSGYFEDNYVDEDVGDLVLLKTVLHQSLHEPRRASTGFESGGRSRLTYHLYPGTLELLENEARLCLTSRAPGIPWCEAGQTPKDGCALRERTRAAQPIYHDGADLTALWGVAGSADMVADLSPLLTDVLRAQASLQNHPAAWTAMQKQMEPQSLARAGYKLCDPGPNSHNAFRTCYCR